MERPGDPYRLYALVRSDLNMPPLKIAAQAGHAYVDAFHSCLRRDPGRAEAWKEDHHGIKVCLSFDAGERELRQLWAKLADRELPSSLIVDLGYTVFDGVPTVTALGVGPARREEVFDLIGHLSTKLPHERSKHDET
jgi:peptidyl-tRNA hydrolase